MGSVKVRLDEAVIKFGYRQSLGSNALMRGSSTQRGYPALSLGLISRACT